jgi:cell division protein FtsI (penicillin-binding protein 3)
MSRAPTMSGGLMGLAPMELSARSLEKVSTVLPQGRGDVTQMRRHALARARMRALWVLLGFALFSAIALARILHLGINDAVAASSDAGTLIVPKRGEIRDRNGQLLARPLWAYTLKFNPNMMRDGPPLVRTPRELAGELVKIFPDADIDDLTARLSSTKPVVLRRRILPEEANLVHRLGEPALDFPREPERYYPQGPLAAHVLGYVDVTGHGKVGMEAALDGFLSDVKTRATPSYLSIDSGVQGALEDELLWGVARSQAKGAAGVVLDVDTGEVLALASVPSFNPNAIRPEDVKGQGAQAQANIFNRATNQVYELGSVVKPITVASAIEAGVITDLSRRYQSSRPLEIGGFHIHDSHNYGDSLNVPEALIHSSNIVLAQIGDQLGGPRLKNTMRGLGFFELPYIELPAKGMPHWNDKSQNWSRISTMTASYGHGFSITPLHLASAYATLVNGGIWRPATLRKLAPNEVPAGRRVWSESTSARMRQLLRVIVQQGTGRKANAEGFRVGGKTGTAEHYEDRTKVVATFAAAFPMDKPRYVVIALLDEPHASAATSGQRTAGFTAAPVVGRLVPRIGPLLGVMPNATKDINLSDIAPLIANGEGE